MSGTKRNVFVVFVFTEMTILIGLLGIQGSSPVTSSTPEMNVTTEVNGSFTVHACQYKESTISCKENERIHIEYANFGRLSGDICKHLWNNNLNCYAKDSLSIVRARCSGKSKCTVPASNNIFGDPCTYTSKYLEVTYQCLPDEDMTSHTDPITALMITSSSNRESSTPPYNEPLCKSEEKRKVNWTATRPDPKAYSPGPNNIGMTKVQRPCRSNDARSGAVNLSESVSCKNTLQLQDKLENLKNNFSLVLVHELMNGLKTVSTGNDLYGGDIAKLAKIMVGVIHLTESNSRMNFSDAYRINEAVVKATSMLLKPKNIKTLADFPKTNQTSTATRLLCAVECSLAILANSINEIQIFNSSAPGLHVDVLVNVMSPKNFSTSFYTGDNVDYLSPRDIMPEARNDTLLGRVTVALFDRVAQWLHVNESTTKSPDLNSTSAGNDSYSEATNEIVVNTRVMSISIVSQSGKDAGLKDKVRFTLEHKEKKTNVSKPLCVFWKYSKESFEGYWSDEGCQDVSNCSDCNYTVCECDHLTNFAILMSVSGHKMSPEHTFALSVITDIGCIISIICLALAFITFCCFRGLQCDRNTIHTNLVLCLFISEIIFFLIGIGQRQQEKLCVVVAGFLHYFFLASFSWMFLEGVQLYVLLIEVFEAEKSRLRWYYLSGYGAPVLIVSISAVTTYLQGNNYAAEDYCWLTTDNGLIWAFTGPVAVIIFMNSVMLGVAIHTMCKHSSTASSLKDKQKSKIDTIGSFVRGAVALMILLGSTWTAGFLYVNEESLFMAYIFTILNSLQGLFIFVFHCLTNEKVRKEYRRCIQSCAWLPEDVRIKYGGLSGSAALSTPPNQSNSSGVSMLKNRTRNQSITSSSFQNSSSEKDNVQLTVASACQIATLTDENRDKDQVVISSPREKPNGLLATPFTQAAQVGSSWTTTSHKVRRHGSYTSESALLTDSSGISSSD